MIGVWTHITNHEGIGIKYENAEIRSLSSLSSYSFFILTVALERLHGTLPMRRDPVGAVFAGMRGRLTSIMCCVESTYYFWRTTVRIRVSNEKARLAPAGGWLTKKNKKSQKDFHTIFRIIANHCLRRVVASNIIGGGAFHCCRLSPLILLGCSDASRHRRTNTSPPLCR